MCPSAGTVADSTHTVEGALATSESEFGSVSEEGESQRAMRMRGNIEARMMGEGSDERRNP
jgi:hypothetical protein